MHIVQAHFGTPESWILLDYTRIMAPHRESSKHLGLSKIIEFSHPRW